MKKIFVTTTLLVAILLNQTPKAHALFGIGDIVFDPAAVAQAIKSYVVSGAQLVKETVSAGASTITATNQTLDTVNNKVLIPARDAMTIIAIIKSGEMMKNLVLGAAGVDPLLIRKPEQYVKKKGQEAARSVLEDPQLQDTLKKSGVAEKIIKEEQYKALSIQSKVAQINQSPLLASSQRSLCTDAALSAQARKDVSDSKGNYSQQAYTARKQALNNALCGNIANPSTQAAVSAASSKTINWDNFLAEGAGQNAWYKNQMTQQLVRNDSEARTQAAATDLANGKGIVSKKKCLRRQIPGNENSVCLDEVVNQTADLINKSFQKSLSNPLDLQLAGFGKGAGTLLSSVTTLAGTAFTTMNLFNSISYGIGGGGGGGNTQDTFGGNNTSITTNTTGVNDLINSPKTKDTILKTPLDQLSTVKKSLIELIKADDLFLTIVLAEKTNLEGVRSCYSNVLESRPDLANDSRITSAFNFYDTAISANSKKYTEANEEKNKATIGIQVLEEIQSKMQGSLSSQEIYDSFLSYEDKFKQQGIPDQTASIERKSQYEQYKLDVQNSTQENGDIYNYNDTCSKLKQDSTNRGGSFGGTDGGV